VIWHLSLVSRYFFFGTDFADYTDNLVYVYGDSATRITIEAIWHHHMLEGTSGSCHLPFCRRLALPLLFPPEAEGSFSQSRGLD